MELLQTGSRWPLLGAWPMDDPEKRRERAANLRDLARRARRLSVAVGNANGDRDRLQRSARELDEQAAALEAGLNQPAPATVTYQQQQAQQQQSVDEANSPDSKPKEPG